MITSFGPMEGNEWEELCQKLLRIKYDDYQEVPAQFGGDLGIEGYCFSGNAFQCYCPDEELTGLDLYKKQRNKITRDIGKLIRNATKISEIGPCVIKQWEFLTPRYDNKELLSHCRTKEKLVRNEGLPEVDSAFRIIVRTEDDYLPEMQQINNLGLNRIHPKVLTPPAVEIAAFLSSENSIVANIRRKIGILRRSDDVSNRLVQQLVSSYVIGRSNLDDLNARYPQIFQAVIQLKESKEGQLGVITHSASGDLLEKVLTQYKAELVEEFSGSLSAGYVNYLAMEALSDWLGRCPLDFPVSGRI